MNRHQRSEYYITDEGLYHPEQGAGCRRPSTWEELRHFRFSRLVPRQAPLAIGGTVDTTLSRQIAEAMVPASETDQPDSTIPAGYTYLGQFVDHDLTMDKTDATLGERVTLDQLIQGRSPALDLDALYGFGPGHPDSAAFFEPGSMRLRTGSTAAVGDLPDFDGFDLAREQGTGRPLIPDPRNDENLAVAQIHLAFIHFHNRIVDQLAANGVPSALLFEKARERVVLHYQWVLRHDFLPRIVDRTIVEDVFTHGRRFFEVPVDPYRDSYGNGGQNGDRYATVVPGQLPTMPIEFSIAAFRLGHSMVRDSYEWNRVFNSQQIPATLALLFRFSGTSGVLNADNRLPSNWIPDWRRLFDLMGDGDAGAGLGLPPGDVNRAKRIDTLVGSFLGQLPPGSFGGRLAPGIPDDLQRNLAFRNLVRADMIQLASGQQAAELMQLPKLNANQILVGDKTAANLSHLGDAHPVTEHTPLWLYILREAELNNGVLTGVGGRIVAEVMHRCMEGSRYSIVRRPEWRPDLPTPSGRFTMAHLLLHAFGHDPVLLNRVQ
uniref:Myeloperoxidase, thyroid peroxidase, cyclooxygenase catalytic domain n=2 Tax=Nonomuraea gerenzanensis TaxID=93944 RepID=A0A1M4EGA1_9ACTN|nr:Myeloperoxidase, thyroid peroxidase, cyclooxygenase catalytic domain [Nonomuraea gerenzanensis]